MIFLLIARFLLGPAAWDGAQREWQRLQVHLQRAILGLSRAQEAERAARHPGADRAAKQEAREGLRTAKKTVRRLRKDLEAARRDAASRHPGHLQDPD